MDELALLKDFRLEDASPDGAREYARARLQSAMTRPRRRLLRRRYAVVLAFAVAVLLAAGAYAIVHEFVIGEAAPKDIQDQVGLRLHLSEGPIPALGGPRKLAGPPVIGAAAHTSAGTVYMLLAPVKGGGDCHYIWYARLRNMGIASGGCSLSGESHPSEFEYGLDSNDFSGRPVTLVQGYAPGAVRIRIGNRFFKTPFGWFLAEWRGPELLTAYGAHGSRVAHVMLSTSGSSGSRPPANAAAPPEPTGPRRIILSTHTGWVQADIHVRPSGKSFTWLKTHELLQVSISPSNRGGRCIYVHVDSQNDDGPGCSFSRSRPNQLQAIPYPVGWVRQKPRPGWVEGLTVLGEAGRNVTRVGVHFSDGTSAPATLREGVIFYIVPRRNFATGHRPVELVGRDASGQVVARKRLPFAR
jgi:hypothetical protein